MGVLNVNKYWQEYSGGRQPQFIEGPSFKMVLPVGKHFYDGNQDGNQDSNQDSNQDTPEKSKVKFIVSSKKMYDLLQALNETIAGQKNKISLLDSFLFKSESYPEKKLEKIRHLIEQRNEYWLPILDFCFSPKSRKEILDMLEVSNQTKNFKNIVQPLVEIGLLNRTIPDKPTSGYQKYYTSNDGKKIIYLLKEMADKKEGDFSSGE